MRVRPRQPLIYWVGQDIFTCLALCRPPFTQPSISYLRLALHLFPATHSLHPAVHSLSFPPFTLPSTPHHCRALPSDLSPFNSFIPSSFPWSLCLSPHPSFISPLPPLTFITVLHASICPPLQLPVITSCRCLHKKKFQRSISNQAMFC